MILRTDVPADRHAAMAGEAIDTARGVHATDPGAVRRVAVWAGSGQPGNVAIVNEGHTMPKSTIRTRYSPRFALSVSLAFLAAVACSNTAVQAVSETVVARSSSEARVPLEWDDPVGTEAVGSWHLDGTANVVITAGTTLFVGGDFTEVYKGDETRLSRTYLVALDRHTGEPTGFAPKLDGEVWALALSPDHRNLYVGGAFLNADGLARRRVAAYDVQTGTLTDFDVPPPNRALRAIAVDDETVYLGGMFTKIGKETRNYVAAFDSATGELDRDFAATPNARVKALAIGADRLWIGGDFTRVGDIGQGGIAALDSADGSLRSTDDVAYPVIALAVSDTQLFIAGGGPGGRAAAFDLETGLEQWELSSDGNFQAVDVGEGRFVYFGGHYETIEGDDRVDRLTRHDKGSGRTDVSWLPKINGYRSINALDVTPDALYVGGDFTKVDNDPREGLAILPGLTR